MIADWLRRLKLVFKQDRFWGDLDEELKAHVSLMAEDLERQGLSPDEATKQALRKFGNVNHIQEQAYDAWGVRVVTDLYRDIRYSARSLWKSKGFSFAVVTTLALCMGLNTSILSALYGLILKPLPFEEPERLVQLFNVPKDAKSEVRYSSSWPQYAELRERTDLFEGCAYVNAVPELLTIDSTSHKVLAQKVSHEFFDVVGVKPILGRFFQDDEARVGAPGDPLVLTQRSWEVYFGADPNVIGKTIPYQGSSPFVASKDGVYTIIGVAPRSMEVFNAKAEYYSAVKALGREQRDLSRRYGGGSLWIRLKQGVSRDMAIDQIRSIEDRWYKEHSNPRYPKQVERHEFELPHPLEGYLFLIEGGALFILLLGCLNVMTLVLSRVTNMRHEFSIRGALGAGNSSLRRLLLIENSILLIFALAIGWLLAGVGVHYVNRYVEFLSPTTALIELDWAIFFAALGIAAITLFALGVLPFELLLKSGSSQLVDSRHRTSTAGFQVKKVHQGLVIVQVALAFVMLVGAGLLFQSFRNVMDVDQGFDAEQVVQGKLDFLTVESVYNSKAERSELAIQVFEKMRQIPGVEQVCRTGVGLLTDDNRTRPNIFYIRGESEEQPLLASWVTVSAEFMEAMGISFVEGRDFRPGDHEQTVIVDELFAKRYLKHREALGTEMWFKKGGPPQGFPWYRVVGVTSKANLRGLEERDGLPIVYTLFSESSGSHGFSFYLRSNRPSGALIRDMQAKLYEIDPRLVLGSARSLDQSIDELLTSRKGITALLVAFAALALGLSIIGVYAVLAYDVAQRRREIGVRGAIGASRMVVMKMILQQGLWKAAIGLGFGVLLSLYLTRFLESMLFDVSALEISVYVVSTVVFLLIAVAASYVPARRAMQVDPMEALKEE